MFWLFVVKELKSIARDPKMLIAMVIVPLIFMLIVYGVLGQATVEQIKYVVKAGGAVSILDMDKDVYAQSFVSFLKNAGVDVRLIDGDEVRELDAILQGIDTKILFIIPKGFSRNISRAMPTYVMTYVKIESLTIGEGGVVELAKIYVSQFNSVLLRNIAKEKGVPEQLVSGIVVNNVKGVLSRRIVTNPEMFFGIITMGNLFIPLIVLLLVVFAAQLVATGIAIEKEEKMFETLLSLPISRMSVIGAKLFVSILISSIYMVAYSFILFQLFLNQILKTAVPQSTSEQIPGYDTLINYTMPSEFAPYLIINVIGLTLFMVSLALLLSLFAEDVRTAQAIIGNVVGPTIVVIYLPMFIEASTTTTRLALSLIPIANTAFLPKLILLEDYTASLIASISNIGYGIVVFIILRKIINSEAIFTLKIFRRRKAE